MRLTRSNEPKQRGKWFPDFRKGTKADAAEYRDAVKAFERNSRDEQAQGIRDETPRFLDLNHALHETERPLGFAQRERCRLRALSEVGRESRTGRSVR